MRFDEHFVEQVRNGISLVDLIGGYVRLKKSGKDFSALCPFHTEKTPSFLVSESKQIFKCFGCGAGGDAFKFIMLMENVSFPEAISLLAERSGIPLPQSSGAAPPDAERRQRQLRLLERADRFFRQCLKRSQGGAPARRYLEERGISADTAERFGIGFAPGGNLLLQQLRKQGIAQEDALECGLLRQGERGQVYDYFRQRIMIPIRDLSGRTIAFGGRILGEGVPKYLNSPENRMYSKGGTLYGLDVARDDIRRRDEAILVEGYFDCIMPAQYGVRNTVASLGTSLTPNQVKLLGRYTRRVIINYDPDSAGVSAALRSLDLFLEQAFTIRVLQLPAGEDPDTFLRKEGIEAYQERCREAQTYLDFLLANLIQQEESPFSPRGKQRIVSELLPYLSRMPNRIERAEYVSRVANRLQIDEKLLLSELRRTTRGREPQSPDLRLNFRSQPTTVAERHLLQAVLERPEACPWDEWEAALFEGLATERIFQKILELKQQSQEISIVKIENSLSEENDRHLLERLALEAVETPLSDEVVRESTRALRQKLNQRLSEEIQAEIRIEEQGGSRSGRLEELLARKARIRRKMEPDLDLS